MKFINRNFSDGMKTRLSLKREVYNKFGSFCYLCGKPMTPVMRTVDHIHPKIYGGENIIENLRPCCVDCNTLKGNKSIYHKHVTDQVKINALSLFHKGVRIPIEDITK